MCCDAGAILPSAQPDRQDQRLMAELWQRAMDALENVETVRC